MGHEIKVSDLHQFSPHWVNQIRFVVGHFDSSLTSMQLDVQFEFCILPITKPDRHDK
jgi:hypothetical protein